MNAQIGPPWERLDRDLAGLLAPALPAIARDIVAEIARTIPDYRRPIEGRFGRRIGVGVHEALSQFLQLIGRPGTHTPLNRDVYVRLGRGELRSGRSLDALQGAYRVGARVAWRRVATVAVDAGVAPAQLALLAESIFAYIEEISAESVDVATPRPRPPRPASKVAPRAADPPAGRRRAPRRRGRPGRRGERRLRRRARSPRSSPARTRSAGSCAGSAPT